MASLESVVSELKELNTFSELTVESNFEINDNLSQLSEVLVTFMNTVPAALTQGFADLINSDKSIYEKEKKDADTREKLKGRDEKDGGDGDGKPSRTEKLKTEFKSGFAKGQEEDLFGGIFSAIEDFTNTAGMWAGKTVKVLGLLKTGMLSLGSMLFTGISAVAGFVMTTVVPAITAMFSALMAMLAPIVAALAPILLPILAIAAAIGAAFLAIKKFFPEFPIDEALDGMKNAISEFWDGLTEWASNAIKYLNPLNWFGGDDEEEPEKQEQRRERVMTKDGYQDLTREEIEQGRKDGTIKRSLAGEALKRLDEQEKSERLERSDNPDIADEGVTKKQVMAYVDQGMSPREAIAAANADSRARQDAQTQKVPGKRGRVIGSAPAAPTKVNPQTGKRGLVIGDGPAPRATGEMPTEGEGAFEFGTMNAFDPLIDTISSINSWWMDPMIEGLRSLKDWFAGLFNFSGIQQTLTNMFAEIGIPRVEFDIPFIGPVGFGPFYPFRPDEGTTQLAGKTSVTTESSGDDYQKTFTDNMSGITEDSVFSSASESVDQQVVNELGQKENITTQTGVRASFDDMTGKGRVSFDTYKSIDNLATDEFKELENTLEEFEVGPIVMGKVRRMIDAGATPTQVRDFLLENEKSIAEKINNFFAPATDELKEDATNLLGKVKGFFGFGDDVGGGEAIARDNVLSMETEKAARAKEDAAQAAANIVNAPSNTSNVVTNNNVTAGPMPSPMDKSDRTSRGAYRGRKI